MTAPRGERIRAIVERGHYPVKGVRLILVMGDRELPGCESRREADG